MLNRVPNFLVLNSSWLNLYLASAELLASFACCEPLLGRLLACCSLLASFDPSFDPSIDLFVRACDAPSRFRAYCLLLDLISLDLTRKANDSEGSQLGQSQPPAILKEKKEEARRPRP